MYRVKLTDFEGPLDLLLFFIKRDELDITDIPIAQITKEYLDSLQLMASLDLEVAGEFIVMAATLMQIKVRMLLPRDESAEAEEDPRAELVRRLIEYKRFKEMSRSMSTMEEQQRKVYFRKFFHADTRVQPDDEVDIETLKDISLFNLIAAYKTAMDHMPKKVVHEVTLLPVTIDEQTSFVMDYLRVHGTGSFLKLVAHMTEKVRIVVTIIAILELTKNKVITLTPMEGGNDILIRPAPHMHTLKVATA
ncbi:MAG: Segregation and condensation protein ScpA [Bacteroidetes bacterium]|jgi:segregation and condensation protein A|nr:Segregation and condensation protein ScpA [Bacteroidota bacterium]